MVADEYRLTERDAGHRVVCRLGPCVTEVALTLGAFGEPLAALLPGGLQRRERRGRVVLLDVDRDLEACALETANEYVYSLTSGGPAAALWHEPCAEVP